MKKENNKIRSPNWSNIPNHPHIISFIVVPVSEKNALLNCQPDTVNIC